MLGFTILEWIRAFLVLIGFVVFIVIIPLLIGKYDN